MGTVIYRGVDQPAGLFVSAEMADLKDISVRVWGLFRYFHPNYSGAAIQGKRILSRLSKQGFSIRVLAAADHRSGSQAGQEVEIDGLPVHYLGLIQRKDWLFLQKLGFLRKVFVRLNTITSNLSLSLIQAWVLWREGKPGDIVQLFSSNESSLLVLRLARAKGMHPVVRLSLTASDGPVSLGNGLLGNLRKGTHQQAEAIISLSSALTENCRIAGVNGTRIVTIPNGVDLTIFHPVPHKKKLELRKELGLLQDRRYIIFVGSAKRRKGIDVLIETFIMAAQEVPEVDLLIVGPCDFRDHTRHDPRRQMLVDGLKNSLQAAGCSERTHWLGEVENVQQYLQASDIFLFPSRREGLPTALIEAMAVGLPVVTSRLEGVTTDLIQSISEGVLINNYRPEVYADEVARLLKDPQKRFEMGKTARLRVEHDFNLKLATQRYAQLYTKLTGTHHV